ncbi:unnamed protein product [Cuscuta campestris]|uniref:Uncharacterized protein n=1 Tax=Cuscuta campestris TaxID=132261 RepID=A0A484M8P6_9ASTE|nr:unnamed protein product [Cuscuta campestris]
MARSLGLTCRRMNQPGSNRCCRICSATPLPASIGIAIVAFGIYRHRVGGAACNQIYAHSHSESHSH